ncbi:DASH complex subunit Dad5 [Schizosaccharomyces japonicus yFS275]|uniref:DASH complex subunit Dad5 n=1 Tax=Schizosaccharomyces japonicus (strain yFS275 / FY16936) TaxID=402676 RepID=B6K113_SCHJY|nr:DASH complex subunit Dad5 [Schizosaccharomyces japonicus yFS275]EEB07634.1 DASH complex subunit Dad5 [Schizosaccharomyces japonicus yFS275]
MRRSTIVPSALGTRPSTNGPSTNELKSRNISRLAEQLARLESNLSELQSHVRVTAIQAEAIRRLGGLQAALLMASGRVLSQDVRDD